jgi:hypothetical protein
MNSKNVFGITQAEPLQILKITIVQEFGNSNMETTFDSIRVLGVQATSSVINPNLPNVRKTEIDYITPNEIFENDLESSVGVAGDFEELHSFEFNFIATRGGDTGSLIVPKIQYPKSQSLNNKYTQRVIDHFTLAGGHSKECSKEQICNDLHAIFCEMTCEAETGLGIEMEAML